MWNMPLNKNTTFCGYNFDISFGPNDYETLGMYKQNNLSSLVPIETHYYFLVSTFFLLITYLTDSDHEPMNENTNASVTIQIFIKVSSYFNLVSLYS